MGNDHVDVQPNYLREEGWQPFVLSVGPTILKNSRPTLTGNKVVTINKMKSAEFARADAEGIFEGHNSFVGLEHLTEEELRHQR